MIPEGSPKYNDLIDVITQAAQTTVQITQKDGTVTTETILDEEILWWKTNEVNHNQFGRFAFELKEWERMAKEAYNHMTKGRADVIATQIMDVGKSYRRSIDAKSSESMRDKNNAKSTLLDKMGRNRIEKIFTQRGNMKRSMFDSFLGKKKEEEYEDE